MRITDPSFLQKVLTKLRRHGLSSVVRLGFLKLVNVVLPLKILRGLHMERVNPAFVACPQHYRAAFASAVALAEFARSPSSGLAPLFVKQAVLAGDKCFAIWHGDALASYGWCSTRPTPIGPQELLLHFMPGYVYKYKDFTVPGYRGRRLHAIGTVSALQHYLARGYRGILCYVDAANLDSLKSCRRMGYQVFGSIYLVQLFGCYFAISSPGCKRFQFRIETQQERGRSFAETIYQRYFS
jgi:hypothetical protein